MASLILSGCSSTSDSSTGYQGSPIVGLVAGQTYPDEYLQKVEKNNREANAAEKLEHNKPTERAYNTVSGKYEFVPSDTEQRWNAKEQRWEFTPARN
ncbi:MAG: hypothetical protein SFY80_04105 [Verrucomicrobiota bacterium]|nr:hypothetical protein [Verrucomicrobiota bacterium]